MDGNKRVKSKNKDWGGRIYRLSDKRRNIISLIISFVVLPITFILSLGIFFAHILFGVIMLSFFIFFLILTINAILRYRQSHYEVYETGIWIPFPNNLLSFNKRDLDEKYFRSFNDIKSIKERHTARGHAIFIKMKSEDDFNFVPSKQKKASEFVENAEDAMLKYIGD